MAREQRSLIERAVRFVEPYRVTRGHGFRLRDFDPGDTHGLKQSGQARELLAEGVALLAEIQEKLYAEDRWSLQLIIQAMDAGGKDSVIKHVMSGVNPQGCSVHSFKHPSDEELQHDFLWNAVQHLPERGRIGIFNRSYYEEVLIVRVHPELLRRQQLPVAPDATNLARALRRDCKLRATSDPQRHGAVQILPQPVTRRTKAPLHQTAREARETLEILPRRRAGAPLLERLSAGL
jgi:polyphosphate kinase 2 (PPK2 family)